MAGNTLHHAVQGIIVFKAIDRFLDEVVLKLQDLLNVCLLLVDFDLGLFVFMLLTADSWIVLITAFLYLFL